MRRLAAVGLGLLVPLAARAEPAPVVGGQDAPDGKWPDAAGMYWSYGQECTGTLVAPTVVLTAGHCVFDGGPTSVLLGTNSLANKGTAGELLPVAKRVPYPGWASSYDVSVIVLAQPSQIPPRAIATGWARLDIQDGASVALVGYGAIDRDGNNYIDALQEATTTITDADCARSSGCNAAAKPAGELGAGGMGIDTCFGDSGGPLYLVTGYGTFLAGVTSRGYDDNQYACSEGGLYTRPDKIVDWIEEQAGVPVARGPEPTFAPLEAVRGHAADTVIDANDPRSDAHTFALTTPPMYGTAKVTANGHVRVCTDPGVAGKDSLVVTITDTETAGRALAVTLPITIDDGEPAESCDVDDIDDGTGGCCDSRRGGGGSIALGIGLVAVLRRRRR